MQRAVPPGEGAMAALLGVEMAQVRQICEEAAVLRLEDGTEQHRVVEAANDNGGGQVVISGHRAAVERAVEIAKGRVVRRAMLLPVSAPFHCRLMQPAAERMAEALATVRIKAPSVPVIANVSAIKETMPDRIRDLLVRQVTGTVRWRESVQEMAAIGVNSFIELGAGKVLTGLARRIVPDAAALNAGTPAEIEILLKAL
jgi:[acyl-carrier-protein] S-malonyltransferase